MKIPPLIIGNIVAKVPIIQGGMGIGISGYRLAAAVANENCIGVISGAQTGYREPDFESNPKSANIRALRKEISKARKLSPKGIIGVNLMTAMNNYESMVKVCIEEKADIIFSGAGLPLQLPKFTQGSDIKIAPIVSSARACNLICRDWMRKYNRLPDVVVVEGPNAGGHLGFKKEELENKDEFSLEKIVKDVINQIAVYEEKYNKKIPVIAAGGIFDGNDIKKFLGLGASGVQMATRFVATHECDADLNYKLAYVNSKKEDIKIIKSPVGMPGRALNNTFIKETEKHRIQPKRCYKCLRKCDCTTTPYCISDALIKAVKGDTENGLIFVGDNAYRINKIVSVKELIQELIEELIWEV